MSSRKQTKRDRKTLSRAAQELKDLGVIRVALGRSIRENERLAKTVRRWRFAALCAVVFAIGEVVGYIWFRS